jgi:hypothetical protein
VRRWRCGAPPLVSLRRPRLAPLDGGAEAG